MEREIKLYLNKLIEAVFQNINDEIKKSYKNFLIKISKKETKINESYKEREITIYNLYRDENEIINSLIIGLAHHIDFCNKGYTNNKKDFMQIYIELLCYALNNGFLSYEDLIKSNDFKNIKRIRDALENFWLDKKSSLNSKVEVYNCFDIRYALKKENYSYSYLGRYWGKIIPNDLVKKEITKLKNADKDLKVTVTDENKITINLSASIVVSGNTFLIKELLKQEGYSFKNGNWKKKINASTYPLEKKLIENQLPKGQGIRVFIEY